MTPVNTKQKEIVFTSFDGHYSDSPKYIAEKIHVLDPKVKIVWLIHPQYSGFLPDYAEWCDIESLEAQKHRGRAVALVDNVYCGRAYEIHKGKYKRKFLDEIKAILSSKSIQPAFTTFHGTAIKRMGRDQIGNEKIVGFICHNTEMIMGNEYNTELFRHLTFNKLNILTMGTPRNDILFKPEQQLALRKKLRLPTDKKIALFAPTWRSEKTFTEDENLKNSGIDQIHEIKFDQLFQTLHSKFGGDWVFVCRFHYHVERKVDWKELSEKYGDRIINGNYWDDMSDYLACTDLLLTDASSCCMDYALTKKPCFLFFPDYDHYKNSERGYYIDPMNLPFPLALDFPSLIEKINTYDKKEYKQNVEQMMLKLKYFEDGNSSLRIAEYILKKLGLNGDYNI